MFVGSGIIRMRDLMREAGLHAPEFNTEGMFTITLQRPPKDLSKKEEPSEKPSEKTVEKTVEKTIIDLITDNPKTTTLPPQNMRFFAFTCGSVK